MSDLYLLRKMILAAIFGLFAVSWATIPLYAQTVQLTVATTTASTTPAIPEYFEALWKSLGKDQTKKKTISVIGTVTDVEHDFFTIAVKNKKDIDNLLVLTVGTTSIEFFDRLSSTTPLTTILDSGDRLLVLGVPMLRVAATTTSSSTVPLPEFTYLNAKEITFLGQTKKDKRAKVEQEVHVAAQAKIAKEEESKNSAVGFFFKLFDREDSKEIKEDVRETSR